MNQEFKYRWTDAWLLASIINTSQSEPAELWEIIAEGDNLNHAIFTEEEIESGLARLSEGGWIKEENYKFSGTDKLGQHRTKKFNIGSLEVLENLLDAEPWVANESMPHPANKLKYSGVSKDILRKAYRRYKNK